MRKMEITIGPNGIKFEHEAEERLTAQQKYTIILALIGACCFLGFFTLLIG